MVNEDASVVVVVVVVGLEHVWVVRDDVKSGKSLAGFASTRGLESKGYRSQASWIDCKGNNWSNKAKCAVRVVFFAVFVVVVVVVSAFCTRQRNKRKERDVTCPCHRERKPTTILGRCRVRISHKTLYKRNGTIHTTRPQQEGMDESYRSIDRSKQHTAPACGPLRTAQEVRVVILIFHRSMATAAKNGRVTRFSHTCPSRRRDDVKIHRKA